MDHFTSFDVRSRRRSTAVAALIGAAAILSTLTDARAQTKPDRVDEVPLPMCTPGIADEARIAEGLGLYEIGDGRLAADVADAEAARNCIKGTLGNLTLNFGGVPLNLDGGLQYTVLAGPQRRISTSTLSPALCESYYAANDAYALQVTNASGDVQGAAGLLGGVSSLTYAPGNGMVTPELIQAAYGPWARCFDATSANFALPAPSSSSIFRAGFERVGDLRVEFLTLAGAPIETSMQTIGADSVYRVRITNLGEVAATGVRVREFVPKVGGQLTPTMNLVSCVRDADAQSCAGADGRLHQDVASIEPGAAVSYVLTRRVNGTPPITAANGALTAVAAFVDPAAVAERQVGDNSRRLLIGLASNGAPVADPQSLQTDEDFAIAVVLTATDPEGNPITFATGGAVNGSLSGTGANRTFTPAPDFFGVASFTFTASDGVASSAPATVTITVNPVNDAPRVVAPLADLIVAEGGLLDIAAGAAFSDPENNTLSFAIAGLPAGITYSPSDGRILGNLSLSSAGVYNVTVTATETGGSGLNAVDQFQLTVTNTNQTPTVVAPIADQANDEGDAVSFSVAASFADADVSDTLTYSVSAGALPAGLSLNAGSGLISGSITYVAANGSPYSVTISVDDGNSGSVSDTFEWVVTAVNAAPVAVGTLADRNGTEGVFLNIPGADIRAGFSDPDGDTLSYSASGLPAGMLISPTDGAILGTPQAGSAGVYVVTVTASDAEPLGVDQQFTLTVAAP